jgi:hypothetical protein
MIQFWVNVSHLDVRSVEGVQVVQYVLNKVTTAAG